MSTKVFSHQVVAVERKVKVMLLVAGPGPGGVFLK